MRRHAFAIVLLVLAVTSPAAAQEAGVEFNLDGRIVDAASPAAPMPFPEYVGPIPKDVGGSKLPFSSSRLVPVTADLVFPYSAVGKLYVTLADGAVFSCTGTVVAPRLVLTAGHCFYVFRNGRGEFATSGTFIPAFRDNMAPYGRWSLTGGLVSSTWFNGGGKVPNAADYALVEVDDLMIDGKPQRISERIGGWIAAGGGKSYPGHVVLLGYPSTMDNGEKLHQVNTQVAKYDKKRNVVEAGADMTSGSSGGPWILNFGVPAEGQSLGGGLGFNLVVGVTSYLNLPTSLRSMGSSYLDQRLQSLYEEMCARRAGNCG